MVLQQPVYGYSAVSMAPLGSAAMHCTNTLFGLPREAEPWVKLAGAATYSPLVGGGGFCIAGDGETLSMCTCCANEE